MHTRSIGLAAVLILALGATAAYADDSVRHRQAAQFPTSGVAPAQVNGDPADPGGRRAAEPRHTTTADQEKAKAGDPHDEDAGDDDEGEDGD